MSVTRHRLHHVAPPQPLRPYRSRNPPSRTTCTPAGTRRLNSSEMDSLPHRLINITSEDHYILETFDLRRKSAHSTALSNLDLARSCLSYMPPSSSAVMVLHHSPSTLIAQRITFSFKCTRWQSCGSMRTSCTQFFHRHRLLEKYKWYWRVEPDVVRTTLIDHEAPVRHPLEDRLRQCGMSSYRPRTCGTYLRIAFQNRFPASCSEMWTSHERPSSTTGCLCETNYCT